MKTKLLAVLLLLSLPSPALEITDNTGRKIDVTVIETKNGKVRFKNADDKVFEVPLDTLTEDSRKAIAEDLSAWAAKFEGITPKEAPAPPPDGLMVSNIIVKKIKTGWFGDTYRYFFSVRNFRTTAWKGSVMIRLITTNGVKGKEGAFNVDLPVGGSATGYFDSYMAPFTIYGEHGGASFGVAALDSEGKTVEIPGGPITTQYEDLSE